jgi:oligopeptidase B
MHFMRIVLLLAVVVLFTACGTMVSNETTNAKPPVTKKVPKVFTEHGNTRTDDYFWLSDPKDSAVIDHLKEENAYTQAYLKHTEDLQKKIYDELVARIDQKASTLPYKRNGYWYYTVLKKANNIPSIVAKRMIFLQQKKFFWMHRHWLQDTRSFLYVDGPWPEIII